MTVEQDAGAPPRLVRAAGVISLATMLSRVLGLARETLFAALVGASAGYLADAFVIAFRIPNLLRDMFAEGALSQAFVPGFKAELKHGGDARAHDLASRVAGTLFVGLATAVLFAALLAPDIVDILVTEAYASEQERFDLTVLLTRIMLPFLPIVSMSAVAMAMLNARDRYTAPALAPATFNVLSITVGAGLYFGGAEGHWVVIGWSLGTLAGGLCQLGIQLPALLRTGFRLRLIPDLLFRDPRLRRIAVLMLPAIVGLAAVQLNVLVNTFLASSETGAPAWLNYAFRFLQFPIGVFGVAIATVSTTRYADAAADDNRSAIARQVEESLRLVLFLTVPATVGLMLLDEQIVRLIFEWGDFLPRDTRATAAALELFAIGLVAYAAVKVIAPAFFATGRSRIPVLASVIAVAGNLAVSLSLHGTYGYRILALGIAVAATCNFVVLMAAFRVAIAPLRLLALAGHVSKVIVASALMGVAVWACSHGIALAGIGDHLGGRLLSALVPVAVGIGAYGLAAWVLRIDELHLYLGRLSRRGQERPGS